MGVVVVHEYLDTVGRSPFARWFERLNAVAAARVSTAIYRLGGGQFFECQRCPRRRVRDQNRLRPGYRVYFGKDGDTVIVLLGGRITTNQADAIARAIGAWVAYKASKRLSRK
jgi:putative addiction module killer protein